MFGTANTLQIVVETKNGTIFDDPATVQKVDRITLELLHDIPGVNGEQVLSITHPKLKTTLTAGSGIKVVPLMYPRVPENKEDLEFLKLKVYTTEGVHGLFVSEDDKATQIIAGFWEEYFDLADDVARSSRRSSRRESDANTDDLRHRHADALRLLPQIMPKMVNVLAASIVMILLILWVEFRSWQGVVIPAFSGTLSAIWGLGFGGLFGHEPRPAGARDPAPHLRARPLALRAVDGALPRGVPPAARQGRGDRQVVHRDLRAGDGLAPRRRARRPDAARGAHPDHPEARHAVLLLDHLDLRQRGDAAPDHPRRSRRRPRSTVRAQGHARALHVVDDGGRRRRGSSGSTASIPGVRRWRAAAVGVALRRARLVEVLTGHGAAGLRRSSAWRSAGSPTPSARSSAASTCAIERFLIWLAERLAPPGDGRSRCSRSSPSASTSSEAEGRRHDARRGAALPRPPVQRRLHAR